MKLKFWFPAVIAAGLVFVGAAPGRSATDDFYKGKTIRIIVGFAAGGGFDTYSRAIGRHNAIAAAPLAGGPSRRRPADANPARSWPHLRICISVALGRRKVAARMEKPHASA